MALNVRSFCMTIYHWNGARILVNFNVVFFWGSLNEFCTEDSYKSVYTKITAQHNQVVKTAAKDWRRQTIVCYVCAHQTSTQCTSSFWFLSELVDFIVVFVLPCVFILFLSFEIRLSVYCVTITRFRIWYPISHGSCLH